LALAAALRIRDDRPMHSLSFYECIGDFALFEMSTEENRVPGTNPCRETIPLWLADKPAGIVSDLSY